MNTPLHFRPLYVLLSSVAVGSAALAQTPIRFSVDYQGPTISVGDCSSAVPITEGDLLAPCTGSGMPVLGPLPVPRTVLTGGAGGLWLGLHAGCIGHAPGVACGVEVDAFSHGHDAAMLPNTPGAVSLGTVFFTVDRHARGIPGPIVPSVFSERPWAEAATDVFSSIALLTAPLPPFAVPPQNVGVIDGNGLPSGSGASYPGFGIVEPSPPIPATAGDNVDAFDFPEGVPASGAPVFFSLDGPFIDPYGGVNTGSAASHGFVGGDVLTVGTGGVPVIYAPATMLGLDLFGPDTDDLDALALLENGDGVFQPSLQPNVWWGGTTDMLLFSVRRGSAVIGMPDSIFGLPIEPGDILTVPLPTSFGGVSPFPGIYIAAENLGLLTARNFVGLIFGDDLNGLDTVKSPLFDCDGDGIEDAVAIAIGAVADTNMDGIPDSCQSVGTQYCFCPSGGICAINPDPTAGCRNTTGAGALLTGTGTTSVTADNLVLTTTSLPINQLGLYLMGTNPINLPFGDGLRCVGGTLRRFPIQNSGLGGTAVMGPGIVLYTVTNWAPAAWILSGQTRRFQFWYRDPGGPCGTGFNLSNALVLTFTP